MRQFTPRGESTSHKTRAPVTGHQSPFSRVASTLDASSFCGPVHKPLHVFAVLPEEMKELTRGKVCRFFSKKRFKPPAQVGALPGFPSVAARCIPVITQRLKHSFYAIGIGGCFASILPSLPSLRFMILMLSRKRSTPGRRTRGPANRFPLAWSREVRTAGTFSPAVRVLARRLSLPTSNIWYSRTRAGITAA